MGKMINRIPCSRLLISSLPGSDLRMHVESLSKPCDVNKHLVNLTHQVFYMKLPLPASKISLNKAKLSLPFE